MLTALNGDNANAHQSYEAGSWRLKEYLNNAQSKHDDPESVCDVMTRARKSWRLRRAVWRPYIVCQLYMMGCVWQILQACCSIGRARRSSCPGRAASSL